MASKYKRTVVGSVLKSKEAGKPDYIKIREDVSLKKGDILRLESKKSQLDSLESALSANKLSAEMGVKARERIEKMPEWVRFEVVQLSTNDSTK